MRLVATDYLSLDGVFEEPGHLSFPFFDNEGGSVQVGGAAGKRRLAAWAQDVRGIRGGLAHHAGHRRVRRKNE